MSYGCMRFMKFINFQGYYCSLLHHDDLAVAIKGFTKILFYCIKKAHFFYGVREVFQKIFYKN